VHITHTQHSNFRDDAQKDGPGRPPRRASLCPALLATMFAAAAIQVSAAVAEAASAPTAQTPDWRDQIIYFVLIDRFDDGEPANNDQGAGEFDPSDRRRYSGGDLPGITRRLDYIQGLGATALWTTPATRHQWWDEAVGYGGYHGYWPQHFMEVDPHFGTLADYRALADALHERGMRLVQDIVVNHTGNYIRYPDAHDPADPTLGFELNAGSRPTQAPTQWPFSQNDARDPAQRSLDIYHWNPAIRDFANPAQRLDWQMADLDDLNTENPLVRRALRASYGYWIGELGVDAFRVDTAFYVPPQYFRDFLQSDDASAPGMMQVAREAGRAQFTLFGEGFAIDRPFEDSAARRIAEYERDPAGPLLPSMINFPLYGSTLDVFARGLPTSVLAHRIESMLKIHVDPHRMPSFVDNHDVERFLSQGSEAGLKQALLLVMSLPGIPVVYYGTEQGFREMRGAMFATGWGSGGRDHFDPDSDLYRYIARVSALRHARAELRRGQPRVLAAESAGAGILAYASEHEGSTLVTAMNTASAASFAGAIETGLAPGSLLRPLFAIEGEAPTLRVDAQGRIDLELPGLGGYVWEVVSPPLDADRAALSNDEARGFETESGSAAPDRARLEPLGETPVTGIVEVRGHGVPGARYQLVLDGELERALAVSADSDGQIRSRVDVGALVDPAQRHRLQLRADADGSGSESIVFRVQPQWRKRAQVEDAINDDHGPQGRYVYPTDSGWAGQNLLDLRTARAYTSGASLRLDIELGALSRDWNPANGFNRVALTVHVEVPDSEGGIEVMPLQNDRLPEGMRWHRRLRVHGWSNQVFAAEGADAGNEGVSVGAAGLKVDEDTRTIRIILPARLLGEPTSLEGARIHISTWDYDAGYRPLDPEPTRMHFGGGDGARDPLWMDAVMLRIGGE
jgi:glycosidase